MAGLEAIRDALPETARDVKLNLEAVLQEGSLTPAQRWGVAVASAATARNRTLLEAVVEAAKAEAGAGVVDDALAAAALMAMNNVYYRFRHMMGESSYAQKPARLRMNRLAKPATNKLDFELFSLAVSAINDCETCVVAAAVTGAAPVAEFSPPEPLQLPELQPPARPTPFVPLSPRAGYDSRAPPSLHA